MNYILVTPDERKVKSVIKAVDEKKFIQEDRDPKTNKLITIITHELNDNDQLVTVN